MPTFALGPAGALVPFRAPDPSYTSPLVKLGATHELSGPHRVRDVTGFLRTITLKLPPDLTAEAYSALESLFVLPDGPYRFIDPTRRNLLTANQSSGTGALRTVEGWSAPAQGTVTSDTAQARSGTRSLKWDTVTSLTLTGRGVYLPGPAGTPDSTWAAVLPSTVYTFSAYVRANAAITMQAVIDWRDVTGATISTDSGTGVSVSTTDWSTRLVCANKTSPSTAAYAVPAVLDSVAPSAIRQVWVDDPQLEQAAAATNAVLGTGVPLVSIDSLEPDYDNYAADANPPLLGATMVLLEL